MSEIVKSTLINGRKSFALALGGAQDAADKYILGVYNTVILSPDLMKCSPESIRDAAITSAVLNVPIDARQYAYLVPYGSKAQFQMSYKGYVHIAKRDPEVDNIQSNIVYEDDEFKIDIGMNTLSHIPNLESPKYGKEAHIKYIYAQVKFRAEVGRDRIFEIMTKAQVNEIKDKAKQTYIWNSHYGEMARKTVIKRLCKHAQLGDVARMDEIDNSIEHGKIINVTPTGEIKVDDILRENKEKIIILINNCTNQENLDKIYEDFRVEIEELTSNNLTTEITKLSKEKKDRFYAEMVMEALDNCDDMDSLDKVYYNYLERVNQLKAAVRNEITEHYCGLKQALTDRDAA